MIELIWKLFKVINIHTFIRLLCEKNNFLLRLTKDERSMNFGTVKLNLEEELERKLKNKLFVVELRPIIRIETYR